MLGDVMRICARSGQLLGAAWLVALLLASCSRGSGATGGGAGQQAGGKLPTAPVDRVFLESGDCAAADPVGAYREVDCSDTAATARVLSRLYGLLPASPTPTPAAVARPGNRCPENTDFVLTISAGRPQGYACMRALDSPHPGDPGGGGGPRTIVGDCVYASRQGEVKETRCDGAAKHAPQFQLTAVAGRRSGCPPGTVLYVSIGPAGVGCARRF
jgi:hypothetical protein